jgi:hypothetical protein
LVRLRLRGFALMLGIMSALKMPDSPGFSGKISTY